MENQPLEGANVPEGTSAPNKPPVSVLYGDADGQDLFEGIGGGVGQGDAIPDQLQVNSDEPFTVLNRHRFGGEPTSHSGSSFPPLPPPSEPDASVGGGSWTVSTSTANPVVSELVNFNLPTRPSAASNGLGPLFPWSCEFRWEDSVLLFGGEEFDLSNLAKASRPSPHSDVATLAPAPSQLWYEDHLFDEVHGSILDNDSSDATTGAGYWAANIPDRPSEVAGTTNSAACTCPGTECIELDDFVEYSPCSTQDFIAWEQNKEKLSGLGSNFCFEVVVSRERGTGRKQSQNQQAPSVGSNSKSGIRKSRRSRKQPDRQPGRGSRDDGSQDGAENSPTEIDSEDERRFACPYLQRNPKKAKGTCWGKFKKICHVKQHLKSQHYYKLDCDKCYKINIRGKEHGCTPRAAPYGFITDSKLDEIDTREDRRKPAESQWQRIYEIIFPEDRQRLSPYLDVFQAKLVCKLERITESLLFCTMVRDNMRQFGYENGEYVIMRREIAPLCIAQIMWAWLSNGTLQLPNNNTGDLGCSSGETEQLAYHDQVQQHDGIDPRMLSNSFEDAGIEDLLRSSPFEDTPSS